MTTTLMIPVPQKTPHQQGRLTRLVRTACLLLAVCAFAEPALAACSGSSPTRTAASAGRQDVLDCVNAAASGDTIRVPSGSATWSSSIGLPSGKDLEIAGASVITCQNGTSASSPVTCSSQNNTNITCQPTCFTINLQSTVRITGFSMTTSDDDLFSFSGDGNLNEHFRIDHNRLVANGGWAPVRTRTSGSTHPQGVIDHNEVIDIAFHAAGLNSSSMGPQHALWAKNTQLGDSAEVIYVEANHFKHTANNVNTCDGNYAGRYVFRFNNTTSGRQTCEMHSVQGTNRGLQRWEVYQNSGSNPSGFSGIAFVRGGSGVIFGNRLSASGSWNFGILMDNVRSEGSVGGSGACDGSSAWDQNTPGQQGWRCRDQIGSGHDLSQWNHSPAAAYNQSSRPAYYWDNRMSDNSLMSVEDQGEGRDSVHIQANRDYYTTNPSFNGTSGVGEGPIGNRPSTCTTGVGYWATNEGEWNSLQSGPDGRLYRCTGTNTWSLYYTPYPYPHPWEGTGAGPEPPAAPTNLRITTSAALLWLLPATLGLCLVGSAARRRVR
jgi:hypothetical protein